jgi:peptide-methionine (S)-S-oxide reductase
VLQVFGLFSSKDSASGTGGANEGPSGQRHAVLGTPLAAPLEPGQAESLFGCGCFWGAEKGFWRLPGVITTAVGYAGGQLPSPTYEQVCSGRSGHAEVVRVVWDTARVSYADLLKLFWECHDPTQGNRQGNDRGSQYRSAIFVDAPELLAQAEASRDAYQALLIPSGRGTITTEITSGVAFHFAEPYHQQYLAKPGSRPYCSAQPTGIHLGAFPGSDYRLPETVWESYDWAIPHCVLRGDNAPIALV